jgi:hypothetical protein
MKPKLVMMFLAMLLPRLPLSVVDAWAPAARAAETFDERRRMFLQAVDADYRQQADKPSGRAAFLRAEALFELDKVEEGRRLVHRGLDQLVPGNRENRWIHGGNSGFIAWPGLDCYVRYESLLDDALKQRYRKIYTGAVFYKRFSTSNHKIVAAVTRYLATQIWGADAFQPDPFFQGDAQRLPGPELPLRRDVARAGSHQGQTEEDLAGSAPDQSAPGASRLGQCGQAPPLPTRRSGPPGVPNARRPNY